MIPTAPRIFQVGVAVPFYLQMAHNNSECVQKLDGITLIIHFELLSCRAIVLHSSSWGLVQISDQ